MLQVLAFLVVFDSFFDSSTLVNVIFWFDYCFLQCDKRSLMSNILKFSNRSLNYITLVGIKLLGSMGNLLTRVGFNLPYVGFFGHPNV